MANDTGFSDSDLNRIETIVKDLKLESRSIMKIKGNAHTFFINKAQDSRHSYDLTTEAWVSAVIQYASAMGYEIKKRD